MTIITWLLILTGVGLNACAQLLLKAAVRPLAHVAEVNLDMLKDSIGVLAVSAPFWAGSGLPYSPVATNARSLAASSSARPSIYGQG